MDIQFLLLTGALIVLCAVLFFLWLRSENKIKKLSKEQEE